MFSPLENTNEVFDGIATKREVTNRRSLIFMIILFVVTIGFVSYSLANGEMARIMQKYDDCGNLCGKDNPPNLVVTSSYCKNLDLTGKNYLHITNTSEGIMKECVAKCPAGDFNKKLNICIEKNVDIDLIAFHFDIPWIQIFVCTAISLAFTTLQLTLFCKATNKCVWFNILVVLWFAINIAICACFWVMDSKYKKEEETYQKNSVKHGEHYKGLMMLAGVAITFGIIFQILVFVLFNHFNFLITMFKEAAKVIVDIPLIVLPSFYTTIVLISVTSLFAYFNAAIWSSMSLTLVENANKFASHDKYEYSIGGLQKLGFALNCFAFFWMWQFVVDCQYFVVASSVSKWFFTRDRSRVKSPIISSYKTLFVYHLGTIAFGSLIIFPTNIYKMITKVLKYCYNNCESSENQTDFITIPMVQHDLQIVTKSAYIGTAIYGYSFIPAGQKTFYLLMSNLNSMADSIGDTILFVAKLLVVFIGGAIGYLWSYTQDFDRSEFLIGLIIILIFSYIIVDSFIDIIGITVDAMFLCSCIDAQSNNGVDRPYFMTADLMEFMKKETINMRY